MSMLPLYSLLSTLHIYDEFDGDDLLLTLQQPVFTTPWFANTRFLYHRES